MSLTNEQIAETFCSWRFAETYPSMAGDIRWNIIGQGELVGKEAVIDHCRQSAKFLETVTTTLLKLKIHRAGTCVVVEGKAQFQDQEKHTLGVASCDIFRFSEERLVEITSYVIDLKEP